MRKLKIILDVDDTLMACLEPAVDIVRESTGYDLRYEDITEWNFLNFPESIRKAFFSVIGSNEYMLQQTPFPGAVELVDLLQEKGHEVIIFSAVPPGTMDARAKMILKYFNIPKQNIVLGGHKDAMYADIMLDDALHNILYSKCRYPILIRRPWNEKEKQVLSVRTYEEFIRMVDKIADAPQSKAMPTTEYGKPGFVAIVGPISSGKTSLVDLIVRDPRFCLTTAVTTRAPRDDDRKDEYHYISDEQFEGMKQADLLIEHSAANGILYGISMEDMKPIWDRGQIPVKAMDIHGAMEIKRRMGNNAVTIFVRRNKKAVIQSIVERYQPNEAAERILKLDQEYANEYLCDWTISNNGDIEDSMEQLLRIIQQH